MVDDHLGVTLDIEASDTQLDGDVLAINECLILGHIVGGGEMEANHVPQRSSRGKTKTSPMLVPFFISDPSNYIV